MRAMLSLMMLVGFVGCDGCTTPSPDAGTAGDYGTVYARVVNGGVEILVDELKGPLRVLKVDVVMNGTNGATAESSGGVRHDVIEIGDGAGAGALTLVVSDTRRVLIDDGAVAKILSADASTVSVRNASAVDENGDAVTLSTGANP